MKTAFSLVTMNNQPLGLTHSVSFREFGLLFNYVTRLVHFRFRKSLNKVFSHSPDALCSFFIAKEAFNLMKRCPKVWLVACLIEM